MYLNSTSSLSTSFSEFRLTLTWDVFKLIIYIKVKSKKKWLTLTWDVFKYSWYGKIYFVGKRLTLTWDVFKLSIKCLIAYV